MSTENAFVLRHRELNVLLLLKTTHAK